MVEPKSGLSPKVSCDSEVNGLSPKINSLRMPLLCKSPPPQCPPAGTPPPEGTRGEGGEGGEGPPRPREPGPSGAEKPGRMGGRLARHGRSRPAAGFLWPEPEVPATLAQMSGLPDSLMYLPKVTSCCDFKANGRSPKVA